ncbi:MAG: hypothetical protein ABS79_03255 [Planctomycetes bacterium SCN 63-9]|nr:MAG: hypothetical protein ABS79_03255 [Planctomycetes bacterium SCN 63-9]
MDRITWVNSAGGLLIVIPVEVVHHWRTTRGDSRMETNGPLSPKEWGRLQATWPRGSHVKGEVTSVQRFGVFVDIGLDPRIPVLLEIIHFKVIEDYPGRRINFPEDYPSVGDEIEARILAYSVKPHDIRLTQLSHLEWIHSEWLKGKRSREPVDEDGVSSEP